MKRFKLLNNIFGWVAFAIAATTYLLTIEPTASFWDCPEFISTAFKLDVGHPPGSPFFMLLGRFFTLFSSDTTQVAMMVNSMTALLSAFTILFLFWTITHIARKVVIKSENDFTVSNLIGILGAGMVGALVYTFSDTFWFSAVEGEVYGFSSFFTAIVFWIILKWEDVADQPGSDRWLIFMAYMMGLSIGVHILNLLAIPAIALVYYFRKFKPTAKGTILALIGGSAILGAVLYGLIPGFVQVACWFELLFVNTLGFSYNTGVFVYITLIIALIIWAIYESSIERNYRRMTLSFILTIAFVGIPFFGAHIFIGILLIAALAAFFYLKKDMVSARWLNTILMMITVLLIGYSSYSVVVIRSSAKPTMDQNSPDNVFSLQSYFNREQYGDRPLFYGPVYNAPVKIKEEGNMYVPVQKKGAAQYAKKAKSSESEKDQYIITGYKTDYVMDERFNMLFPRMYSSDPRHIEAYKTWGDIEGKTITFDYYGQQRTEVIPTFAENMKFFISYQLNFMYWRYFFWNFAGRQNDMQSSGEIDRGNWISGIPLLDNWLYGDQSNMPSELKENKGHNTYFLLPLLLGILGMIFLIYGGKEGVHNFWVVALLFFLTGVAIVLYLNQTPYQPRERDYAYAGSFYAFSIWIGFGVLAIVKFLENYIPKTLAATLVSIACLGVPTLMAQQNWDDHDRSGRYVCRDFGQNYLSSCQQNAIIFTNGDNDTFPLWYNQEVEGFRTDVRACNLSYLQTDWYINQMKREAYKSKPLPISWQPKDYIAGKNEVISVENMLNKPLDLQTAYDFLLSTDPNTKYEGEAFIPSNEIFLPVDAQEVVRNGAVPASRVAEIAPQINFKLNRRVTKSELMIMEMLKENKWKRPVYFAMTVGDDYYLGMKDHFELTGLAYRVLPVGTPGTGSRINIEETYNNMMTKFKFGGIENPNVYLDETILRMCYTHRMVFSQLAQALVEKGDKVRAKKVLDYCNKVIPGTTVRHDFTSITLAECYYKIGEYAKGNEIMEKIAANSVEYLNWYMSMNSIQRNNMMRYIGHNLGVLQEVLRICDGAKQKSIVNKYYPRLADYSSRVQM